MMQAADSRAVVFPARGAFALQPVRAPGELGPRELRGPTLCSLISPGTELAWAESDSEDFPLTPAHAAVFRADEIGAALRGQVEPGALWLCLGPHRNWQQVDARHAVPLPTGLAPERAVLARLLAVTMKTLMTTAARPGERVLVTGAGPVGFLAARLFALAGHEVWLSEPDAARRRLAEAAFGASRVLARLPDDAAAFGASVALVLECSGHEQAVLDACRLVRERGEVVLVGVPWMQQTGIAAHALLDVVFRRQVVLRSGWSCEELIEARGSAPQTVFHALRTALDWLADEQRIGVDGLIHRVDPPAAAEVYRLLRERRAPGLFPVIDWRGLQ